MVGVAGAAALRAKKKLKGATTPRGEEEEVLAGVTGDHNLLEIDLKVRPHARAPCARARSRRLRERRRRRCWT